ncbi:hypothetical protein Ahy_A01g001722 isoform A [Arachis hypogaea]|uniref:G protein gamma domain-containing protein n=1 Tax=Arachis hypogaea TaxID=3818 RepID=A0A445EP93_ARAHY|nr:hypothetical protein Ahy_A01g001722 isoform A [Arachis hypogaea]
MATAASSSSLPSLPPPSPKSPPDLYGKRRDTARLHMLDREITFLEVELKNVEALQPASACCKEVADFVVANSDPLLPSSKKNRRSCRFWKWLCGLPCHAVAAAAAAIVFPPSIAPCQNGCAAACVPLRHQIAVKGVTAAHFPNQVAVNGAAAVLVPDQSAVNGGGGAASVALVLNQNAAKVAAASETAAFSQAVAVFSVHLALLAAVANAPALVLAPVVPRYTLVAAVQSPFGEALSAVSVVRFSNYIILLAQFAIMI